MGFIKRELLDKENGFYSALDADSEGEEGKYYVWSKAEIDAILKEDASLFCAYYDVSEKGNWPEGKERPNILRVKKPMEVFAEENGIQVEGLKKILERSS